MGAFASGPRAQRGGQPAEGCARCCRLPCCSDEWATCQAAACWVLVLCPRAQSSAVVAAVRSIDVNDPRVRLRRPGSIDRALAAPWCDSLSCMPPKQAQPLAGSPSTVHTRAVPHECGTRVATGVATRKKQPAHRRRLGSSQNLVAVAGMQLPWTQAGRPARPPSRYLAQGTSRHAR